MKKISCKICKSKMIVWYKKIFDDRHGYPGYFNIYRCTNCGFAQTNQQFTKNKIIDLYTNYYPRKKIKVNSILLNNYKIPKQNFIWRKGLGTGCHFFVKPNNKVLDIGSGVGYSLLYLKNNKCNVYGLDPDLNAKKVATKFKINFHQGFIEDKPFKNESFGTITASQVLEHTIDPTNFLKIIRKRLTDRGQIILSFPNGNSLTRILLGRNWLHWHIPYHLNHFNKKSLLLLIKGSKLKIVSIKTITPNLWTNIQIKRLFLKPKMGIRDSFWDGVTPVNKNTQVLNIKWIKRLFHFMEEYNYFNRFIDWIGLGESFVVILQKV